MVTIRSRAGPTRAVEIVGPWLLNKGDDLMLLAVCDALMRRFRVAASSNLGMSTFPDRLGLHRVLPFPSSQPLPLKRRLRRLRRQIAVRLLSPGALSRLGVVPAEHVSALLDCSGFAYGDQWSPNRLRHRESVYASTKRRGGKIIMLPQAVGPFQDRDVRAAALALFRHFDMMFLRDGDSLRHILDLGPDVPVIEQVPDITHLLPGRRPNNPDEWTGRACIIPNSRMLDKTSPDIRGGYIDFMVTCIRRFHAGGMRPFLMLHESNDAELARSLTEAAEMPLQIIDQDAAASKGIIGCCAVVLSSRYHALVSALSQAVPAIGTSWSHKYDALFREYDCTEALLSPANASDTLDNTLSKFTEPEELRRRRLSLEKLADRSKVRVEQMWVTIRAALAS